MNKQEEDEIIEFSQEEEAYRRGFIQGFVAARTTDVTYEEVKKWRYGDDPTAPPGTGLAGKKLSGLTLADKEELFLNTLASFTEIKNGDF